MPDRRTLKTKKAIKDAFLSQLKNKDLSRITVTKIVNTANIGRGTFYLHYLDVLDLYESLVNELFDEIEHFFDNAYPTTNPENLKKLMKNIINFISVNNEFFLIMLRLEGSEKTISKLKNLFYDKVYQESIMIFDNKDLKADYLNTETIFIISGIVGVVDKWLNDGLSTKNEELMEHLHQIIMKFNL